MPYQSFSIDQYEAYLVPPNTTKYPYIYSYIRLYWGGQHRATLWFYWDSAFTVDLLRNEKPVFFQYNDTNNGAILGTGSEPVGEVETSAP